LFFSADLKKRKTAEEKKAYELFQQLQDSSGAPDGLQFDWRFGDEELNFPNWGGTLVAFSEILSWFDKCQTSLDSLEPELLSAKCKEEQETWNTEFFELKEDLKSWMRANPNHKTPTPTSATKTAKVQLVFYSSALFSLLYSGRCTIVEC
jgi:hypothetical protein